MSTISQFGGGGVKSVQSGVAGAAGSITITAVNTAKTIVHSVSKGSAGTVAATGTVASHSIAATTIRLHAFQQTGSAPFATISNNDYSNYGTDHPVASTTASSASISGGTTNLVTKQYSAVLTNSTTITTDGPCEFQVVEYY